MTNEIETSDIQNREKYKIINFHCNYFFIKMLYKFMIIFYYIIIRRFGYSKFVNLRWFNLVRKVNQ